MFKEGDIVRIESRTKGHDRNGVFIRESKAGHYIVFCLKYKMYNPYPKNQITTYDKPINLEEMNDE